MDLFNRQKLIMDKLNEQGTIRISELSKDFHVSRETIRKDIYSLEKKNSLQIVRGGATLPPSTITETRYSKRQKMYVPEKTLIAKTALSLIRDNKSIFLDYGTTTNSIAYQLNKTPVHDLTVVTDSTNVLKSLEYKASVQTILLGGGLRQSEGSLSGPLTFTSVDNIYCDIGFFGCGGIDPSFGVTNHYFDEVEVSKRMMHHCKTVVLVADHSKFEFTALYKTASLQNLDIIITDQGIKKATIDPFYSEKVKVILA